MQLVQSLDELLLLRIDMVYAIVNLVIFLDLLLVFLLPDLREPRCLLLLDCLPDVALNAGMVRSILFTQIHDKENIVPEAVRVGNVV